MVHDSNRCASPVGYGSTVGLGSDAICADIQVLCLKLSGSVGFRLVPTAYVLGLSRGFFSCGSTVFNLPTSFQFVWYLRWLFNTRPTPRSIFATGSTSLSVGGLRLRGFVLLRRLVRSLVL